MEVIIHERAFPVELGGGESLDVRNADAPGVDQHRENVLVFPEVSHLHDGNAEGEFILVERARHRVDLDGGKDSFLDVKFVSAFAGDVAVNGKSTARFHEFGDIILDGLDESLPGGSVGRNRHGSGKVEFH